MLDRQDKPERRIAVPDLMCVPKKLPEPKPQLRLLIGSRDTLYFRNPECITDQPRDIEWRVC